MGFWKCVEYLCMLGVAGFFLGRILPEKWTDPSRRLYQIRKYEKDGKIYEKLKIRQWQSRVPDMSHILPRFIPPKNMTGDYKSRLPVMIRETCVAELVHIFISILGLRCLKLWPGIGGVITVLIHILLLNLPFILIQRYNRPRLLRLQEKLLGRENKKGETLCEC